MKPLGEPSAQPGLHIEERQALAARRVALGPGQGQGHLRGGGRGEPLASVEPPAPVVVLARLGAGKAHVGAAGALGHPLAGGPEALRVAGGEAAAPRGPPAPGCRCPAGCARRRRSWPGGRCRCRCDGMEQVDQGGLVEAGSGSRGAALVGDGHQAPLGGDPLGLLPQRGSGRCGRRGCPRGRRARAAAPRGGPAGTGRAWPGRCRPWPAGTARSRPGPPGVGPGAGSARGPGRRDRDGAGRGAGWMKGMTDAL